MSKDKPEVGDIWKHNNLGTVIYITEVGSDYIEFIGRNDGGYFANGFREIDDRFKLFLKLHTYLGKSKCKVEDLFKTENE